MASQARILRRAAARAAQAGASASVPSPASVPASAPAPSVPPPSPAPTTTVAVPPIEGLRIDKKKTVSWENTGEHDFYEIIVITPTTDIVVEPLEGIHTVISLTNNKKIWSKVVAKGPGVYYFGVRGIQDGKAGKWASIQFEYKTLITPPPPASVPSPSPVPTSTPVPPAPAPTPSPAPARPATPVAPVTNAQPATPVVTTVAPTQPAPTPSPAPARPATPVAPVATATTAQPAVVPPTPSTTSAPVVATVATPTATTKAWWEKFVEVLKKHRKLAGWISVIITILGVGIGLFVKYGNKNENTNDDMPTSILQQEENLVKMAQLHRELESLKEQLVTVRTNIVVPVTSPVAPAQQAPVVGRVEFSGQPLVAVYSNNGTINSTVNFNLGGSGSDRQINGLPKGMPAKPDLIINLGERFDRITNPIEENLEYQIPAGNGYLFIFPRGWRKQITDLECPNGREYNVWADTENGPIEWEVLTENSDRAFDRCWIQSSKYRLKVRLKLTPPAK